MMNFKDIFQERNEVKQQHKNAWLTTFNDLLSLLITFFILTYSVSQHTKGKWQDLVNSFDAIFQVEKLTKPQLSIALDIDYLYEIILANRNKYIELSNFELIKYNKKIIINVALDSLFKQDSNQIKIEAEGRLYAFFTMLYNLKNEIQLIVINDQLDNFYYKKTLQTKIEQAQKVANLVKNFTFIDNINIMIKNIDTKNSISSNYNSKNLYIVINDEADANSK